MGTIIDFFLKIFDPSGFSTKFGCGPGWTKELIYLHVIADLFVWLAYMIIPMFLVWIIKKRKDIPFDWVFWCFAMFIFACGFGHLIDAICATVYPMYRFYGLEKVGTAIASWVTIYVVYKLTPVLLAFPSMEQLQKQLEEKTKLEVQLTRAYKEAEQFNYIASHDLQEPLRSITSYLQLLEIRYKQDLDTDAKEYIGFAVKGAKRMHDLITDLLAYSKITNIDMAKSMTDLNIVMNDVIDNLHDAIKRNDAKITIGKMPTMVCVPTQMVFLFQNLISNSIKFHKDDVPPVIEVKYENKNNMNWFYVKDNGIGIDPKFRAKLFDVFKQYDKSREGTGVGLAIVKKIVENHNGEILVDSKLGEGATFAIGIPS